MLTNISFLRYFYAAAKNGSMSKAAEKTFVTQSAISQGISKLEIELGKQLITHSRNSFQLTTDGKILLEKCEEIFSLISELEDIFNEEHGQYKGKLVLATSYSFGISLLPAFYKKLFDRYPEVQPILKLGHTGLIREFVRKGEVDFGIVLVNEDLPGFDSQEIFHGEYRLYQAKKSNKTKINRLIISEDKREDNLLVDYLRKSNTLLPPIMEALSWQVIAGMVEQGLGIGFLPDYVANTHHLKPFDYKIPKIPYRIMAISRKNKELTRNAKMFIHLMVDASKDYL